MNLFSNLKNNDDPAIMDNEIIFSYKRLNNDLKNFDNFFENRSLVLFMGQNSYESLLFYIYCLKNKHIPILLDPETNKLYIEHIIDIYKPEYIYLPKIFSFENSNYNYQGEFINYYFFKIKQRIQYDKFKNLALLLTTSGSTGSPKFIRLSYKNLSSNCDAIINYLNINKLHRAITSLPFNYSYGLSIINTHINAGASLILSNESMTQKTFWYKFNKYSTTSFAGVPFHYEILKNLKFENFNLEKFEYSTVAGGALDETTLNFFINLYKKNNKKLFIMYGQTEASPRISYVPWEKIIDKKNSIGIPLLGGKIYLKNIAKNIVNNRNEGELIYSGPNVCLGYAENYKDLSLGDINKGTINTGDVGYKDKDNYFYIVGRKKRFAKIYGLRINLDELEKNLRIEGINTACLEKNSSIYIFISDIILKKNLKKILSKKMNLSMKLVKITVISKIPLKSNGKYDYIKLLDL